MSERENVQYDQRLTLLCNEEPAYSGELTMFYHKSGPFSSLNTDHRLLFPPCLQKNHVARVQNSLTHEKVFLCQANDQSSSVELTVNPAGTMPFYKRLAFSGCSTCYSTIALFINI